MVSAMSSCMHATTQHRSAVHLRPAARGQRLQTTVPKQCRTHKRRHATAAIELDWSDSGTWTGVGAAVLGIAIGIGAPIFYSQRDDLDEARLEELREMNRQHYKETGRYLTDDEIQNIRQPRWTDRREFQDDD